MKEPTKSELREELKRCRNIGAQFANLCYNLSQSRERVPEDRVREQMKELQVQWDEIPRTGKRQ